MGAGSAVLPGGIQLQTATSREELDPRLKYDMSGKKPIVLIPQPSDDPDDPLVCFLYHSANPIGKRAERIGYRIGRYSRGI
jgi:hypothetical protein